MGGELHATMGMGAKSHTTHRFICFIPYPNAISAVITEHWIRRSKGALDQKGQGSTGSEGVREHWIRRARAGSGLLFIKIGEG